MYRDHRKGPGGPPGGATCPGGPRGLKVEGNQPLVGWGAPHGPPPAPRVGNPRVGAPHLAWGASHPPWPPPPGDWISQGPAPPRAPIYSGGEGGQPLLSPWRLPPVTPLPPRLRFAKPCRDPRYFHHHAVVLLDLHQLLLPPCWIKKEETSLLRTCVERGGAVRSALGHR